MTRRPLRIALDAMQVGSSPAGIGRYIIELVRALDTCADSSCEITAYVSPYARAFTEWRPRRVKLVPIRGGGGIKKRIIRQQLVLPGLVNGSSDIVHYPDYHTGLRNSVPSVVTIHDMAYAVDPAFYTWSQRVLRHLMHPVALRTSTTVVADSEFTRREILRLFPETPPEKVRVVYLGIRAPVKMAEDVCSRLRERLRLPERFALSVCTREPRKNLDTLLHAFGKCSALADQHLVLVGGAGWGRDSLSVLNSYGSQLTDRVTVTGYVDDRELVALYHMASAFVYISLLEGFGLPPLEALSYGTPVVASDIPVLREVLGDHAIYVDPHDIEHIGAGIRTLLNNDDLRGRLSSPGILHSRRFTWERCASEMLAIYREAALANVG